MIAFVRDCTTYMRVLLSENSFKFLDKMLSKNNFLKIINLYNIHSLLSIEVCYFNLIKSKFSNQVTALCHKLIGIVLENYNRDFTKMKFDHPENPETPKPFILWRYKGAFIYYERVFWGSLEPPTHYVRTFSLRLPKALYDDNLFVMQYKVSTYRNLISLL